MKQSANNTLFQFLHVITWIIFIGLSVKAGAIIFGTVLSLIISPGNDVKLYPGLDFRHLMGDDKWYYLGILGFIVATTILKAHMFYMVLRIFNKMNLAHPFTEEVAKIISDIAYLALGIGIITYIGQGMIENFEKHGIPMKDLNGFLDGGQEFLLLGAVLYIIGQVYKRGVELQNDNSLTI